MDIKEYKRRFMQRSTKQLIKGYSHNNAEYRAYAREEFKRRRVPAKQLPYTKPKRRRTYNPFMLRW